MLSTYSPRGAVPRDTTAMTTTLIARTEADVDLVAENNMRTRAMGQMTGVASRFERGILEFNSNIDRFILC